MAVIEAEGQRMTVSGQSKRTSLYVEARAEVGGSFRTLEERVMEFYEISADERPRTRGDLTADAMEELARRVAGRFAEESRDEDPHVKLKRLEVEERTPAKRADEALAPTWEDDWPADGSKSDRVRYLLDEQYPTYDDEDIVAVVGCSRSLVNDVRKRMSDDDE
jgi:hypothetical protein